MADIPFVRTPTSLTANRLTLVINFMYYHLIILYIRHEALSLSFLYNSFHKHYGSLINI